MNEHAPATGERRTNRREDETRCVVRWRFARLLDAGYARREAATLATRRDVDLHAAVELLDRGCPAATALAILV